jgi:cytochrome c oxidase subunit 4
MMHQIVSLRVYVSVFTALMVLTGVTVAIARLDLGPANFIVAITIAFAKASLVVLFFMHVKGASALTKLFLVAGLFWIAILIIGTFHDYASRAWLPTPSWLP